MQLGCEDDGNGNNNDNLCTSHGVVMSIVILVLVCVALAIGALVASKRKLAALGLADNLECGMSFSRQYY
jgi:hypothetical protein